MPRPLRTKRFGNPGEIGSDGKPWDGIHMRGRLAARHYTNSIIRIMLPSARGKNSSIPQDYHLTCPQTMYQNNKRNNIKRADRNQYYSATKGNYWARQTNTQSYRSNGRQDMNNYQYNVGVSNRFGFLGN